MGAPHNDSYNRSKCEKLQEKEAELQKIEIRRLIELEEKDKKLAEELQK